MRYGFNNATTWSDPVASDSLAWLTLLGAAGAVGRDENLSVRFLWTRLGPSSRRVVETFCQVVILLFAVYFIYSGILLMGDTSDTHVRSEARRVGKEGVSQCRSRLSRNSLTKKTKKYR